jgi:hypothetical protein
MKTEMGPALYGAGFFLVRVIGECPESFLKGGRRMIFSYGILMGNAVFIRDSFWGIFADPLSERMPDAGWIRPDNVG